MIRETTGRGSTLGIVSHPLSTKRTTTVDASYALGMLSASAGAEQRAEAECRELLGMLGVRGATTFDRQYIRGEIIFEEGEQGNGLYFLTDGVVKLSKAYSVGKEATLMLVSPWYIFGNLAFGQTTYQHARAEALTTCWVRKVPKVYVERAVKSRPEAALRIASQLMRS